MVIYMKYIILTLAMIMIIGMCGAQDLVKYTGGTPLIKDLGNLTMQEITAIFEGGDSWMKDAGAIVGTPTQRAFLNDNGEGTPLGNITNKTLYLGKMTQFVNK